MSTKPANRSGYVAIKISKSEVRARLARGQVFKMGLCNFTEPGRGDRPLSGYCAVVGHSPTVRYADTIVAVFWRKEDCAAYMAEVIA